MKKLNFAAVLIVGTLFSGGTLVSADDNYFVLTPMSPFLQDWSNTALISANDVWTGVPSINGYRGDDLTTGIGVDPQTILADGSATPIDVNANQTNPDSFATGGVAEFEIADPVVALTGSATADAPFLDIRLNTAGCVGPNRVVVRYVVRDIDASSDDAVQRVALHYRVGNSGTYTNVSAAYVADATTASSATQVTNVAVALPPGVLGQANVHLRIMTTNAAGSDEWVGIDNIDIRCVAPTAAGVTLGGRVLDPLGRGIAKAAVTLEGGNLGAPRTAVTGPFGYYAFEDLPAGLTYVLTVGSKRYTFASPTRVINLDDELTDADFIAEPNDGMK